MESGRFSESPVSSPDIDYYEECVVAEEDIVSSVKQTLSELSDQSSPASSKASKRSGRVVKKSRRNRPVTSKKSSSQLILKWLEDNYETVPGSCLPRSVLYTHYQDFCKRNHLEPSAAASFGKIIRMKFPNLSTRRLGTRGQSKYHYYGLAIKESSIYFRSVYSKQGLTRFSGASLKKENGQPYNPTSKTGILLPEFPTIQQLNYSKSFPIDKVETFLLMYRAHCQRILDSVVRANFHEVQDFLVHFWQGMPPHIQPILKFQETADLVVICDFILYNCLCEVLIPASLQQLPDNLIEEILSFSHKMVEWMFSALQDLPASLGIRKVQTVEMFAKSLRRQTTLVQLAKGARGVLRSSESVGYILNDWRSIDFEAASSQIAFTHQLPEHSLELFKEFARELEQLLVKQSSLEIYFEWLDSLIERKVCEPASRGVCNTQELSQDFLVAWASFYLVVEKEVSYLKGKSFDCFRILHVSLNEYIHHVVELLQLRMIESQFTGILHSPSCTDDHPHPPKMEDGSSCSSGSGSCSGGLPPIFPPTPTSASSDTRDFVHYFENRITQEYQEFCPSLQSPNYAAGLYSSYFKQEGLYHQPPSCMHPTSLPVDSINSPHFDATPPPLTPQSSFCSSNSPLSHISIRSPESAAMTPDMETARPISQGSMCSTDSPQVGDMAHPSLLTYSTSGSSCTSPLQHALVNNSIMDIGTSLQLVAASGEAMCGPTNYIQHGYGMMTAPPIYPTSATTYPPMTPPVLAEDAYPHDMSSYSAYDFELHQLMSDPSDLLTECISEEKDVKPSVAHLSAQAHSSPAII